MASERYIICGGAAAKLPTACDADAVRLHLYGADDDNKITLQIDDLRKQMYRDVPARFHDLLDAGREDGEDR